MFRIFLVFCLLGQAAAVSTAPAKTKPAPVQADVAAPAKAKSSPKDQKVVAPAAAPKAKAKIQAAPVPVKALINPPLKDVSSDKKFFGPPFPADYPEDTRPVVQKSILDKLKGPDQPYPALQSQSKFDSDFVKDENSDTGHWKAQFEYDALRKKIGGKSAAESAAEKKAAKEGKDVEGAQKKADEAAKAAEDAKKAADEAATGKKTGDGAEDAKDGAAKPSKEALEELKKKVAEAEENLEKEKKQFEECKKKLEEAKQAIEDLKAKQESMEAKLAGDTKLWVETKTVKLNLHKAKQEAAQAKHAAAEARLKVAMNTKEDMDKILAREKAENDRAQENFRQRKAAHEKATKDLEKAAQRLQKLRGYTPPDAPKSSASVSNSWFAWLR